MNQRIKCSWCDALATTTGPLGEPPLCCACAAEDDGTPEWQAEDYARRMNLSPVTSHYFKVDGTVYEVWHNGGRWTAAETDDKTSL